MPGTMAVAMCFHPSRPLNGLSGWAETQATAGFSSRSRRVTPVNVPLVPSPATKWLIVPSVCRQISSAVVR